MIKKFVRLTFEERIKIGERYTMSMFRNVMRDSFRIEKGFNKKRFDALTTSHDILEFIRLFFEISKDGHGFYRIEDATFFNEYYIETKSKKVAYKSLIIN